MSVNVGTWRTKMAKPEAIKLRRREVMSYTLQGMPAEAIAKNLGISSRQVERDRKDIQKEIAKSLKKDSCWKRLAEYSEAKRLRIKRLWIIITNSSSSTNMILKALRELREEDAESFKKEQSVGIFPKEPSPLISVESSSGAGDAENRVQINIIAPVTHKEKKKEIKKNVN